MKIALWGKGKTGSKVLDLYPKEKIIGPFGRENNPTLKDFDEADVILLFIPGESLKEHLPLLLETKTPIISGATGYDFVDQFKEELINKSKVWIQANNFSVLMMAIKKMISYMGSLTSLIEESTFEIQEIHHTKKLDAPSGTALSWKKWLGEECEIESIREGDEIGTHSLELQSKREKITLTHKSLSRDLFAQGAIFACKTCLELNPKPGFYDFAQIIEKKLKHNEL